LQKEVNNKMDERDRLKEEPFGYEFTKSGKTLITYQNRQIMILSEKQTKKFMSQILTADTFGIQLALAKVTKNFKRGNEKQHGKKQYGKK
jgi:hypothetical protein